MIRVFYDFCVINYPHDGGSSHLASRQSRETRVNCVGYASVSRLRSSEEKAPLFTTGMNPTTGTLPHSFIEPDSIL
jgi:hypothetical protein